MNSLEGKIKSFVLFFTKKKWLQIRWIFSFCNRPSCSRSIEFRYTYEPKMRSPAPHLPIFDPKSDLLSSLKTCAHLLNDLVSRKIRFYSNRLNGGKILTKRWFDDFQPRMHLKVGVLSRTTKK